MTRFTFAILALAAAIAGCASQAIPNAEAVPVSADRILDASMTQLRPGSVPVTIKRDAFGSACTSRVFVDNKAVADLDDSQSVTLQLVPGDYIIGAQPRSAVCSAQPRVEMRTTVKAGAPQNVRIGFGVSHDIMITPLSF